LAWSAKNIPCLEGIKTISIRAVEERLV